MLAAPLKLSERVAFSSSSYQCIKAPLGEGRGKACQPAAASEGRAGALLEWRLQLSVILLGMCSECERRTAAAAAAESVWKRTSEALKANNSQLKLTRGVDRITRDGLSNVLCLSVPYSLI